MTPSQKLHKLKADFIAIGIEQGYELGRLAENKRLKNQLYTEKEVKNMIFQATLLASYKARHNQKFTVNEWMDNNRKK